MMNDTTTVTASRRVIVEDRPTGGNAKLRAKLDACQLMLSGAEAHALENYRQWSACFGELSAVRKEVLALEAERDALRARLVVSHKWADLADQTRARLADRIEELENQRPTGTSQGRRLAEARGRGRVLQRYREALEVWLALMEFERDAKPMAEGEAEG